MKNVGIVTHPLYSNYGGVLQAVALYKFLENNGFNVFIFDKQQISNFRSIKGLILAILRIIPFQNFGGYRENYLSRTMHADFLNELKIKRTNPIEKVGDLLKEAKYLNIDAIVVGSDQVWRWDYIKEYIYEDYFLKGIGREVNKISYAASFGNSSWEEPTKIKEISYLLNEFDYLSVRELSGKEILKDTFLINDVQHVVDPTLLIGAPFFEEISENIPKKDMGIFTYILDENEHKNRIIEKVSSLLPNYSMKNIGLNNGAALNDWVASFRDAKFVITDSFHGMIFSLIFEKQFYVIPNIGRGVDRFDSILSLLDIEDRKILSLEDIDLNNKIDYSLTTGKIKKLVEFSSKFLLNSLNSK